MISNKILLICLAFIALTACSAGSKKQTNHHMENEKRTLVKLETTMGNITVALYNETPKHRDNFIKLVKEGVYDSTLFHRVIKQFMIQAGDPDSKNASDTAMLGSGDVGYTIPAEFNPKFFHKKGVLAAARQGDDVNPEKASSGCQFYIVTGRKFTEPQLLGMENKINEQHEEALFDSLARQHMKEIYKMRKAGDNAGLLELQDTLEAQARELADKEEKFRFTPEQIKAYSTVGGAPHLDGSYTVFGEVTEGMEVVENIEIAKTNRADRPVENIRILKASVQLFATQMININRYTLSNGLRVIHNEDNTTQMVALNLLYDVGARDEDPDHTGFAHLFEHLMFGGSVHVPDYDTPVQNAGGENNAWTNNDITNYYITLPRQNVETGFWLESDRMLSLDFNPRSLEVQRQVVIEEFKQRNLNQPYGDASHLLRALAYKVHPYQWPTIGKEISHIANATLEEVKAFFFKYYAPDNAILAVTGHITFEETVALAEKWFGPIPRRNVPPRSLPAEPRQTEERRLTVERNVPVDALFMAFHICERRHPDYYAFDMLSDLLSSGRSCRLVQHLVQKKQVFNSIDAYISGSIDEGLFHITGKPAPGVTLEAAETAVWQELKALTEESVDEDELEKVKNRYESEQIFNNLNYLNVATNLAYFELTGKAEDINNEVNKYRSVTAGQIKEAAQKTFVRENCSTLYYKSNLPT